MSIAHNYGSQFLETSSSDRTVLINIQIPEHLFFFSTLEEEAMTLILLLSPHSRHKGLLLQDIKWFEGCLFPSNFTSGQQAAGRISLAANGKRELEDEQQATHGSFARSWYPKAWFTVLCCALWLPQLLLDSRLALAIWSNSCRIVQTQLFSCSHHVKISATMWTWCLSKALCIFFFLYEGKVW